MANYPVIRSSKPHKPADNCEWTVYCDGSAPSGGKSSEGTVAFAVFADDLLYYCGGSVILGNVSDAKAEARAVFTAMKWCHTKGITTFYLYSDAKTLVEQLNGFGKTNNQDIQLTTAAIRHTEQFLRVTYGWVPRELPRLALCDYLCKVVAAHGHDVGYTTKLEHDLILGGFYAVQ